MDVLEVASYPGHHHVPDAEFSSGMPRFKNPRRHFSPSFRRAASRCVPLPSNLLALIPLIKSDAIAEWIDHRHAFCVVERRLDPRPQVLVVLACNLLVELLN